MSTAPALPPFPLVIPCKPRRYKPRASASPAPAPPAALVLVAASFDPAGSPDPTVTLTFDRPVSIAGPLTLSAITVDDNVNTDEAFAGTGAATLVSPAVVRVPLVVTGGAHGGSLTLLSASAATGLVAVDDGGTWAGVVGVAVPFG